MAPQVVFIRHAQALHNDSSRHDPPLSDAGRQQCAALGDSLEARFGAVPAAAVAVLVSPMRRTLQTASLALGGFADRGVSFEASADWQEYSDKPCDTGSPVAAIASDFPRVDFSRLDPVWPDKTSGSPAARRYAYSRSAILARAAAALEALYRRPERLIFVVSHSAFLRLAVVGCWFFNGDYRVFDFAPDACDHLGRRLLVQDESTTAGGLGWSSTEAVELGSELPEHGETEDAAGQQTVRHAS